MPILTLRNKRRNGYRKSHGYLKTGPVDRYRGVCGLPVINEDPPQHQARLAVIHSSKPRGMPATPYPHRGISEMRHPRLRDSNQLGWRCAWLDNSRAYIYILLYDF